MFYVQITSSYKTCAAKFYLLKLKTSAANTIVEEFRGMTFLSVLQC